MGRGNCGLNRFIGGNTTRRPDVKVFCTWLAADNTAVTCHTDVTFAPFVCNMAALNVLPMKPINSIIKMNKKLFIRAAVAAAVLATGAMASVANAQSIDALLDKLIEKNILTVKEAKDLREDVDKDFAKAYAAKSGMPDWVTSMKLYGDVRMRYENIFPDAGGYVDRTRFRYRVRPGLTVTIKDNFEVGMRLTSSEAASGSANGGDPISGNTSFSGNGSKKFIYIDLAYAKWKAVNNTDWTAVTTVGKMENPFQFPGTMVFDKDYTPEGFAEEVTYRFNDQQALKLTGAGFVLNEAELSQKDSYMLGAQLRLNSTWSPKISSTIGAGYFSLLNRPMLNTSIVPNQGRGNTRTPAGDLVYGYSPFHVDAGVTYTLETMPLYTGKFPITVSGDYLHNPSAPRNNDAYSVGITMGKAGKKSTWQLDYRWTSLEADAWYEEFTESDFGATYVTAPAGGSTGYRYGTNVRGHWAKLSYSPFNTLTLSAAYFATELINPSPAGSKSGAGRLQIDAVVKF